MAPPRAVPTLCRAAAHRCACAPRSRPAAAPTAPGTPPRQSARCPPVGGRGGGGGRGRQGLLAAAGRSSGTGPPQPWRARMQRSILYAFLVCKGLAPLQHVEAWRELLRRERGVKRGKRRASAAAAAAGPRHHCEGRVESDGGWGMGAIGRAASAGQRRWRVPPPCPRETGGDALFLPRCCGVAGRLSPPKISSLARHSPARPLRVRARRRGASRAAGGTRQAVGGGRRAALRRGGAAAQRRGGAAARRVCGVIAMRAPPRPTWGRPWRWGVRGRRLTRFEQPIWGQ
jgi:hypothetical protein